MNFNVSVICIFNSQIKIRGMLNIVLCLFKDVSLFYLFLYFIFKIELSDKKWYSSLHLNIIMTLTIICFVKISQIKYYFTFVIVLPLLFNTVYQL